MSEWAALNGGGIVAVVFRLILQRIVQLYDVFEIDSNS